MDRLEKAKKNLEELLNAIEDLNKTEPSLARHYLRKTMRLQQSKIRKVKSKKS